MSHSGVLIAEDSQTQQKLIATMLAAHGIFRVSYAQCGDDVLDYIRLKGSPDLILLDLHMPKMDGIDLLYELSDAGFEGDIILMSSRDSRVLQSAVRVGLAQGLRITGSIQKPIEEKKLIGFIKNSIPLGTSKKDEVSPRFSNKSVIDGLRNNEFISYFQPVIDKESGELITLEALSRWHHPEYGTLSASEFLPLVLHHSITTNFHLTSLKKTVTDFVVSRQSESAFSLSINLDPVVLRKKSDVSDVLDIVTSAGLEPDRILLELPIQQVDRMQAGGTDLVNHLNLKGFRVALQGFGPSSTALNQVVNLPVSMVKISSRYVREVQEDDIALTVIQSLLDMSRKLGIDCVATDIESEGDWDLMRGVGCGMLQGFLICKPKPIEQFKIWASSWDKMLLNQSH